MNQIFIILSLLIFCISSSIGQMSDYQMRQQLVSALQMQLDVAENGIPVNDSTIVNFSNFSHEALRFLDYDGSCKVFTNNELKFINNGDYVTFKALRRYSSNNLNVLPGSHPMICNLNAWLFFAWGYSTYKDSLGGKDGNHKIGEQCQSGTQSYFMGKASLNSAIKKALQAHNLEWLSEDQTSWNDYTMFKYNGDPVANDTINGTNLFECPRQRASSGDIHYIGTYKLDVNGLRDTGLAKIAYSKINFKDYANFRADVQNDLSIPNGAKKILTSIEISAHTQEYSPDCSFTAYSLTSLPKPQSQAGMDLKIEYLDANGQFQTVTCSHSFSESTPDITNATLWEYFSFSKINDDTHPHILHWVNFEVDNNGYLRLYLHGCNQTDSFLVFRIRNRATPAEYCEVKLPKNGTFSVDNMTGEIIYTDNQNVVYPIPCLEFCKKISGHRTVDGVVASSAVKLSDAWDTENSSFQTNQVSNAWYAVNRSNNAYETGARGHWRPEATFAYKTTIRGATGSSERIYSDAGVYLNDQGNIFDAFRIYDWRNPSANTTTKWLQLNTVTITSPYGEPLEEKDILGIYSSAKFSHKNTVPKMVARNAPYSSIEFQSFEDWSTNVTNDYAHSGRYSLELSTDFNGNPVLATILPINQTAPSIPNFLLSVWVKQNYPSNPNSLIPIESSLGSQVSFKKIAQTGEWSLYEAEASIPPSQPNAKIEIKLKKIISEKVWIDDFKIQPLESEATCYAYDPVTLKLAAQFDDRHFGVFYQYNSEGKLIRKLRETERGLKTVTETQYHTPLPYYRDGSLAPMAFSGPNQPSFGIQSSGNNLPDIPNGPMNGVRPPSGGVSADVDMLNLEVGPQGYDLSVFGSQTLPDWDSFTRWFSDSLSGGDLMQGIDIPSLDSLQFPAIPAVEQVQALQEIKETENLLAETVEQANNQSSDSARQQLMLRAAELRKRRQELIEQRLGISEQEFREFVERNRVREDEEKSNEESDDQEHQPKGEEE